MLLAALVICVPLTALVFRERVNHTLDRALARTAVARMRRRVGGTVGDPESLALDGEDRMYGTLFVCCADDLDDGPPRVLFDSARALQAGEPNELSCEEARRLRDWLGGFLRFAAHREAERRAR